MKNKFFYLKISVTIILIAYLIDSIGLPNVYKTITSGNIKYFLLSCSFVPIFIFIKTWKWHLMVSHAGTKESFSTSLRAILTGLGFGIFTPARAGEIIRIQYYSSIDKIILGGLVFVDRLIDLHTVIFLGIYFIFIQFGVFFACVVFLINATILLLLGRLVKIYKLIPLKYRSGNIYQFFEKIGTCLEASTPIDLSLYGCISFLNWLLATLQFYLIINMYHLCDLKVAIACLPIIQLCNILPITIAGIGVRENLSVFVMKIYDVPGQVAASGAFSLYMMDGLIPGVIGLMLFSFSRNR